MGKIVIIGAGALGKCFAALLAEQAAVTVYERNPVIYRALRKGWFIIKEQGHTQKVKVRTVSSLTELAGDKVEVLIIATKIMDMRGAVAEAAGLDPRCVFFPQNGIFDIGWTKRFFKRAHVCRGVTTMACQERGPGQATLFYRGDIYIGGDGAPLVAGLFCECGIGAKAYRDSRGPVWAKLIFSAAMNPLPVITGQKYDILKKNRGTWELVRQAVKEGRAVARALRVRLAFDPLRLIRRVRDGDLTGISHRGSIFQDISAGRLTELDFITGALVRQARRIGIKTPALDSILARAKTAGA
ncbi:MAG: 2-dehydropantoate 2-reductase [Candidatus Omnitrophota bacterium]|nr:2-dehydropantoate 2-reductase [Candidatus Omnitrophota bacterium]